MPKKDIIAREVSHTTLGRHVEKHGSTMSWKDFWKAHVLSLESGQR
jgi:hypothetical protein